MQNAHIAAEAALPLPALNASAEVSPLTVNDIIDAYLKEKRNKFADRVCKDPESVAAHFIPLRAVWGTMTVKEFRKRSKTRVKEQVEKWRDEAKWKISTCRKRISQLKTAFRYCVDEEIIKRKQMPVIKLPPQGAPRERFLDMKELAALLDAAESPDTEPHIRLCLHLSLRTGQRQSAIHALTWPLVDFENRVIRFRDTEAPGERTKKRRTDMPMDDVLHDMLLEAKDDAETEFVLERHGRHVASTYAGMKALYERAGIEGVHRHDLRRTAATLAYRASGDMNLVANLLGDTPEMAAKHYAQTVASDRLKPVEAISSALASVGTS